MGKSSEYLSLTYQLRRRFGRPFGSSGSTPCIVAEPVVLSLLGAPPPRRLANATVYTSPHCCRFTLFVEIVATVSDEGPGMTQQPDPLPITLVQVLRILREDA